MTEQERKDFGIGLMEGINPKGAATLASLLAMHVADAVAEKRETIPVKVLLAMLDCAKKCSEPDN